MKDRKTRDIFSDKLRKVSICSWILKLIPIPVGLITAELMAGVVTKSSSTSLTIILMWKHLNGLRGL